MAEHMTGEQVRAAWAKEGKARARAIHAKGTMNSTERSYARHLELMKGVGQVLWWNFEGITIKLGDDCRYTPDFMIVLPDWTIAFDDTKGAKKGPTGVETFYAEGDAMVKIRSAAKQYPMFHFRIAWMLKTDIWRWKEIG